MRQRRTAPGQRARRLSAATPPSSTSRTPANHAITGRLKERTGSRSTNTAPRNAYRAKDGGWVCLSSSTQGMTEKLFRSIGRPDLIADPRFRTNPDRLRNWEALHDIVAGVVVVRKRALTAAPEFGSMHGGSTH